MAHDTRVLQSRSCRPLRTRGAWAVLFAMLLPVPAFAILAGDPNGNPADNPQARIDLNTTTSPWAGVGSLTIGTNHFSGVLIDQQYVLTAAHVVAGLAPEDILFNLNYGTDLSHRITVESVWTHPDFTGFSNPDHDDIALLRLSQPVPEGVPYYALSASPLAQGTETTLVGYGASGNPVNGITVGANPAVKRTGGNALDRFVADAVSGVNEVYYFDFDGPTGSGLLGGPSLGNDIETTLASGDSGSGAFWWNPAAERWDLAGINTFVFSTAASETPAFGSGGGGVLTYAYTDWVYSTIAAVPETQTWALMLIGLGAVVGALRRRRSPCEAVG